MNKPIYLWIVFYLLIMTILFFALRACLIKLPYFGEVLADCPSAAFNENNTTASVIKESSSLLSDLLEIEVQMKKVSACPNKEQVEIEKDDFQEATQVIAILDTSGSMMTPVLRESLTDEEITDLFYIYDEYRKQNERLIDNGQKLVADMNGKEAAGTLTESEYSLAKDRMNSLALEMGEVKKEYLNLLHDYKVFTRMEISKKAISTILDNPPGDKPISLWGFQDCGKKPLQIYPSTSVSPSDLVNKVEASGPTPLVKTLKEIPSMVKGGAGRERKQGVNVVLFADGHESCDTDVDICEVAEQVKQKLPFLWIYVVQLVDELGSLSCIAESTGGKVIRTDSSDELEKILRYASEN